MATPSDNLANTIRGLLERLVASRRLDYDDQEVIADEVAAHARVLPREGIMEALDKAVGSNSQRRQEAVFILSELSDVPGAVERIGERLKDPDKRIRSWLIQTVEHRRLAQFAPLLNDIIERDPDSQCRTSAIHAAGTLKQRVNLGVLLRLAEQNDPTQIGNLAWALKDYATEECRTHLQRWFENRAQDKPTRVISAWGLGKLGDEKAISYLARMLEDPDRRGSTFFKPGQSLRAAQALCDIYGWQFKWHTSYVASTTRLFKESSQTKSLHSTRSEWTRRCLGLAIGIGGCLLILCIRRIHTSRPLWSLILQFTTAFGVLVGGIYLFTRREKGKDPPNLQRNAEKAR